MAKCPNGYSHRGQQCMCPDLSVYTTRTAPVVTFSLKQKTETLAEHQRRLTRGGTRLLDVHEAIRHGYQHDEIVKYFGLDAAAAAYWRGQEGEAS